MSERKEIKVLLIHPHLESSADGIASHCDTLYHLFLGHHTVHVMKPENYPYRKMKIFNGMFVFSKLIKAIKESGADIVHVHGYTTLQVGQALLAAIICRKKIVYSPHWHPFHELNRPFLAKMFFNVTISPLVRYFASCCVCINNEDSRFMKKMGKPVYTIPHCLSEIPSQRHVDETASSKKSILFVGRFDATNKGIDHLWHLPEGAYDIHLVGKGKIFPRSDMTVHQNIPKSELNELYSKCSVVVIPSQYEAFSLVALEALSIGTPVIMSNKVRIADYIEDNEGVFVFKYGDYRGFCLAVQNSERLKVDTEKIHKIFSKEAICAKYADLYSNSI